MTFIPFRRKDPPHEEDNYFHNRSSSIGSVESSRSSASEMQ